MKKTKIFISYSREDERIVQELRSHLKVLERTGEIDLFFDSEIKAGENWDQIIRQRFEDTDIILFIISAAFLSSDYTYGIELRYALNQYEKGLVKIIPIIARACDWKSTPLGQLQALPSNGVPITNYKDTDEAYLQIVQAIKYSISDFTSTKNIATNTSIPQIIGDRNIIIDSSGELKIGDLSQENVTDVFPLSGVPTITFVEPVSFKKLISSIKHKGRGLVIEGPSGIGKTTAIKKAIERLGLSETGYKYLSARNPDNIELIKSIRDWHSGIVIIDDFHRLDDLLKSLIADYLKFLADIETSIKKLIIIGIPNTGIKLISFGHDLATRIDIFEFSKINSDKLMK